jgi:hypothetical protein
VTKLLRTQRTLPAKLETVVALAKETVPNCDAAGVALLIEGEPTSTAVSDRLTVEVDLVRYETGQGPCLAAIDGSTVIRIDMVEGLVESLETQALIGQASGVIMAEEGRTADEALDRLRALAMTSGESLRTVATWVLEERPTSPGQRDLEAPPVERE